MTTVLGGGITLGLLIGLTALNVWHIWYRSNMTPAQRQDDDAEHQAERNIW